MSRIWDHDVSAPSVLNVPIERSEPNAHGYSTWPSVDADKLRNIVTYVEAMGTLGRAVLIHLGEDEDGKRCLIFSSIEAEDGEDEA